MGIKITTQISYSLAGDVTEGRGEVRPRGGARRRDEVPVAAIGLRVTAPSPGIAAAVRSLPRREKVRARRPVVHMMISLLVNG